jgi:hypothetical protein
MDEQINNLFPGWECTDPDTYQYRFDNSDGSYTFKQFDWLQEGIISADRENPDATVIEHKDDDYYWNKETINLANFEDNKIDEYISAYGYRQDIDGEWVDENDFRIEPEIIAECIFECIING